MPEVAARFVGFAGVEIDELELEVVELELEAEVELELELAELTLEVELRLELAVKLDKDDALELDVELVVPSPPPLHPASTPPHPMRISPRNVANFEGRLTIINSLECRMIES